MTTKYIPFSFCPWLIDFRFPVVKLCETPPSLTVDLGYQLLFFTVDIRVGHVLASLPGDSIPTGGTLARMLEFMEKAVASSKEQVPMLLGVLQ